MKRIAVEEHITIESFVILAGEQTARRKFPNPSDPDRMANVLGIIWNTQPSEHRITEIDKFGIDVQIFSVGGRAIQNDLDTARSVANAKYANDVVFQTIQQYPNRVYGFGILAMQDPNATVQKLERCFKELGFVGIMMLTHTLC